MKLAFLEAFVKRGGVKALLEWSNENPSDFYRLCGRLLPQEHDVTSNGETMAGAVWVFGSREVPF